ncbi:hypothetical protein ACFQVC_10320 [Streptomyces monticola]|uniref:Integral membrane protein n=1 Tax=Streptomyces monticola TaxID=2666263 RepID=A0ABW2JGG3_9ACTN
MAGTGEAVAAEDDDALYVLTAVLLTPAKFPSVLGDDYPEACSALGLAPPAEGYGLVLGQDGDGARWTVVVDDVSLVAVAIASWDCGMEYDLSPDERTVVAALPGWPLPVAVAAPGVPAPHDPEPDPDDTDGRILSPPDTSTWGPAQRRLGADEIALQWATWRAQIDDADFVNPDGSPAQATAEAEENAEAEEVAEAAAASAGSAPADQAGAGSGDAEGASRGTEATPTDSPASGSADTDASTAARSKAPLAAASAGPGDAAAQEPGGAAAEGPGGAAAEDSPSASDAAADVVSPRDSDAGPDGSPPLSGVRRVLEEARAYVDTPPPLGRVRSAFATQDARTLRADGPGWSLVARTDDIAFVLLDEEPGEVLPVGRGPELPGLLEALDKMAVRPA